MSANLLVELFTEELPPKALQTLGEAFAAGIADGLAARGLVARDAQRSVFATPRRLAVRIAGVLARGDDRREEKKLMPAKIAFNADGSHSAALLKRLEKEGYPPGARVDDIERRAEGKEEFAFLRRMIAGQSLQVALQSALEEAIEKLPIPKVMSYQLDDGATTVQFVRPAHGLVALHGADIVPIAVLGLTAGRTSHGHRFQGVRDFPIAAADAYEEALRAHGKVIAGFTERRAEILRQLETQAQRLNASLGPADAVEPLLDEVTALVEYPTVYAGEFEAEFLAVPQECLVLTMRANQKYFPLFDAGGRLTNRFLIVSNMELADAQNIVGGNQRVIRPRLADARFFFDTDRKTRLEARVPQLGAIVYHNKLGSQLERTERVQLLAGSIARAIGADPVLAERAAWLAKGDLVTSMVGEFPELQGVMGRYYALADGEDAAVAAAIGMQYSIRAVESASPVAHSLYLADRLETLAGIWGIGLKPTGDKDPFGLRRAALGIISAFEALGAAGKARNLQLPALLAQAVAGFKPGLLAANTAPELVEFVYERYRNQLAATCERNAVDAVIAPQPPLQEVAVRLSAVVAFSGLPEAASLAAANKRTGNILKKEGVTGTGTLDAGLLVEPAEKALANAIVAIRGAVDAHYDRGEYIDCLKKLAALKQPVDDFFEHVLVNAKEPAVRANRLALLSELGYLMNRVADISRLAA